MEVLLFPFEDYWWFYLGFTGLVFALVLFDLGIVRNKSHVVTTKEAVTWSSIWIGLALAFNVGLYYYALHALPTDMRLLAIPGFDAAVAAKQVGIEFLTGFVIEKALAVDNIFVFIVIFSYFAVPARSQRRILIFGIIGALIFRAGFIALGASLLRYHWVILIAGAFLILTGIKLLVVRAKQQGPGSIPLINLVTRFIPVTAQMDGGRFFIRKDGVLYATPLFLALLCIEISDIIFAIDSVPAIFAVTKEPLIVFTSNIFAVMGLRSLYFLLADAVAKFRYLKVGLGFILVFVGLKMVWLNGAFDGTFPVEWSLAIIGVILGASVTASLVIKPNNEISTTSEKSK